MPIRRDNRDENIIDFIIMSHIDNLSYLRNIGNYIHRHRSIGFFWCFIAINRAILVLIIRILFLLTIHPLPTIILKIVCLPRRVYPT